MTGDRDLLAFRQEYYEFFVSLFSKEPSGELLLDLSNGIRERTQAAGNLHALLAQGWDEIGRFLRETPSKQVAEAAADEYTRLFIGPHAPEVNPYESFYVAGRLLDRPLADLKIHLKRLGIEKQQGYSEPEDFLAFELEVMRWLIRKQTGAADSEEEKRWLRLQADFLKDHLLVWAPSCARDIEKARSASFYRGAATMLRGFLEVERTFMYEWGVEKVKSLEEARRAYGAIPPWKGPTFTMPGEEVDEPFTPKDK